MYRTSTVIHKSTEANLTAYTYDQVVVGGSGSTDPCVINGTLMNLTPCCVFNIRVISISGGTDIYLIGNHKDVFVGSTSLP